ncbi:glutathione S-transferase family protein [Oceanicoccus sagamiensis]|uniref:Glutathione S-transferase n=1 Tax=Oceanicoccus sagamiensis TaxID=716816 RepID=A0A1X9NAW8_9GAMM|nr:glutathione S-transferase family protein [Oceanicoccus sagamiensis]ARN75190.1 hypothetical protein BST96_14340 [Oceanicoccus sagamiensis]
MKTMYRMYGWQASHFAAKLRGYLNYKQLDYQEKNLNAYELLVKLPKKTGASAMPALETREGEWLSDTPEIITELERRHPDHPIMPATPRQLIAALIFENWVDDCWLKISMHTRWSYPENFDNFLKQETGKALLPFAPGFIRERIAEKTFAGRIRSYLPSQGIIPEQFELLERWSLGLLDLLEQHFTQHEFLFGGKPTIADFALVGSFFPHLNRDPWPKREWVDPRPNLQAWVNRTHSGERGQGELVADDQIPETLLPLFKIIAGEFFPLLAGTVTSLRQYIETRDITLGSSLPRVMDKNTYPMADSTFTSSTFTYSLWRMQRIVGVFQQLPEPDQALVDQWFESLGLPSLMAIDFGPALERNALSTRLKV